ncbi:MAG TPA: SET domain-containing protein-lysine N-methyltransferase [Gemmatimonadaceae bacterium]|nr:SET domain-containing protein-lysine N-methyltransferase [Gemmatimonadaceae bacterium]
MSRSSNDAPFELRRSAIQGRGAFATRRIRPGARIIEYLGEHISRDEGDRRYDDEHMGRHHTFLFALDDGSVIDAAVRGNAARFINHSCDPNCQAIEEDGRIFIEAIRNIQPGTELTYDYAYERTDDHTDEDEALYVCRCGAPNCRGTILAPVEKKKRKKAKKRVAGKRVSRKR